ncbi:hypothetical protein N7540_009885 [Penicillium herquei]|nr:hypothetical protein N7540_009885 [Penicillium herquei]
MASSVANSHPVPSPPPAYLRNSPPLALHSSNIQSTPRTIPVRPHNLNIIGKIGKQIAINTKSEEAVIHNAPRSPVKINRVKTPQASSVKIENIRHGSASPKPGLPEFAHLSLEDPTPPQHSWDPAYLPRRNSPQVMAYPKTQLYSHTPNSSGSWSAEESQPKANQNGTKKRGSVGRAGESNNSSSHGSLESIRQVSDIYEPLAYHHNQPEAAQAAKRSTLGMQQTDKTSSSTGNLAVRSRISRPLSTYSSSSEMGANPHKRNLSASPYMHARSTSRNSTASPDNRSTSFLDLLNTSYPQPGPSVAQFDNSQLRSSVGNNASLLSHKETFEMYLGNVKKTDEPAVQYEFAVFMINSMHEMPQVDLEDSNSITRARLLLEAKSILQRLAERSYPFAQYYLGDGFASGLFNKGKMDYDRAFPLFKASGRHGHVEACYRAALCLEFGWGTTPNAQQAIMYYRQAASKNHPGAMMRMAEVCLAGELGQPKKYREGVKWMKLAADSADAQYNSAPYELGLLHVKGFGDDVFADESYAAQLFTKSAELGHAEAAYRLGDAYEHGGKLNCPKDPALSIHFYTAAAQKQHPLAMMALCAWYLVGAEPVLERDEDEAYEWAARAANLGLPKAQFAVGYFTEVGMGCRRDPLEANVWYVKAADQGEQRAKERIARIQAAADGMNTSMQSRNGGRTTRQKPNQAQDDNKPKQKRFAIF